MKRFVLTAGLACALAIPGAVAAQTATKPRPTAEQPKPSDKGASSSKAGADAATGSLAAADKTFMMKAAAGGMAEVELGRLATEKASSADVKQFGQRMVDDHSKANDELKALASQKSVTLPTDLDAKHKATKDRLSKLSGDAFDKAYMADMVADHNEDVAEFARVSKSAKDADVKAFAAKTLPTLQEHQRLAKEVAGKVRGSASKTGTAPKSPKKSS
jgi:putative membrane protein